MEITKTGFPTLMLTIVMLTFGFLNNTSAQNKSLVVRVAKIQIDSAQLKSYKAALNEEIETAVRVEPGVLTLYAVAEKDKPSNITVFEIYTNQEAYKANLEKPHFKKYKNTTKEMVKSLELTEGVPIVLDSKAKL